jgi:hypothetical protein
MARQTCLFEVRLVPREPGVERVDDDLLVPVGDLLAFENAGFLLVAVERIHQVIDEDLAAHAARLRLGGVSTLESVNAHGVELRSGRARKQPFSCSLGGRRPIRNPGTVTLPRDLE